MISRRYFIKAKSTALTVAALSPHIPRSEEIGVNRQVVLPTPGQQVWQDCEVGVIYHFDLSIAAGDTMSNNAARKTWNPDLYQPHKLDTDQWIEAAKAAGARYAIFTATHFNGFMQWQSDAYSYGLKQTSWRGGKGDMMADFGASCRKADIKPGINR